MQAKRGVVMQAKRGVVMQAKRGVVTQACNAGVPFLGSSVSLWCRNTTRPAGLQGGGSGADPWLPPSSSPSASPEMTGCTPGGTGGQGHG